MNVRLAVFAVFAVAESFVITPSICNGGICSSNGRFRLNGMAQPEVEIKTKTKVEVQTKQKVEIKKKAQTGEPVARHDEDFQDAPMYKLMLLSDDGYDGEHVISRMTAIMEDLDEDAAATVFQQAMQEGKAMCGKYPFERAELFKEQLLRSDPMVFADLEEENA